ncbi:hypothetical protein N183_28400 [Sinorhizobium sp. Sb3]|uniref:hypothetical protein n=1 Tax=Sinorhizobium sp. Sb3 TaxID=1358417 RepID=UPI00071C372D|nr:hypothetical protein [Sinorhizobium sp. Sb3]KSV71110.1 hypothetical protein N183_28400 [Sinorhizobium sp. Sb3]
MVQPVEHGLIVDRQPGEAVFEIPSGQEHDPLVRSKCGAELCDEIRGNTTAARRNDRQRPKPAGLLRQRWRLHGEPAREKRRHRLAQAGQRLCSPLELVVANLEYYGITRCNHGGNAGQRGKEADLTDKLALADLGDGLGSSLAVHREAARQNDEEAVRAVSLTNENLAAAQDPAIGVGGQSLQCGQRRLVEQQRRR